MNRLLNPIPQNVDGIKDLISNLEVKESIVFRKTKVNPESKHGPFFVLVKTVDGLVDDTDDAFSGFLVNEEGKKIRIDVFTYGQLKLTSEWILKNKFETYSLRPAIDVDYQQPIHYKSL